MRPKHDSALTGYYDENLVKIHNGHVSIGIESSFAADFMNGKMYSGNPFTEQNVLQWLQETYQAAYDQHVAIFPLIPEGSGFAEGRQWINNKLYGYICKNF
jgi:hypothetical protein